MKTIASLLALALLSSCVTRRTTERGSKYGSTVLSTKVSDGPPAVKIEGDVAKVVFTRQTCNDVKDHYPTQHWERRVYPSGLIFLMSALAFSGAFTLAVSSTSPAFIWPEAKPAITPVGIGLSIASVIGMMTGAIPMMLSRKGTLVSDALVKVVRDGAKDEVVKRCSDKAFYRNRELSYSLLPTSGQAIEGRTASDGLLRLSGPAQASLLAAPVDERGYRQALERRVVDLKVRLDDAPAVSASVRLSCLERRPEPVMLNCKLKCAEAGEARCVPQYERCMERVEDGRESRCTDKFEACLVERMVNKPAFDECYLGCLNKDLADNCR